MKRTLFLVLIFNTVWAQALQNPLTLGKALDIVMQDNLSQQQQQLNIDKATLTLNNLNNLYTTKKTLDFGLANRSEYNTGKNNSHAFIYLKNTLYNQQTEIDKQTQLAHINYENTSLKQLQQDKTLEVMRVFFDIILADMNYQTALEKLAIAAVREAQVKDDYDIQKASEVDLLEKQTHTQIAQIKRIEAESEQIKVRAKLAQLLNLDYTQRPDDLLKPDYQQLFKKELAEFEYYQQKLTNNIHLKQLQQTLLDVNTQISQEQNNLGIIINSNIRIGEQAYLREKNGHWRVALNLTVPLGTDVEKNNKLSTLQLQSKQQQLEIKKQQQIIEVKALDYYFKLKSLKQTRKALLIELDYQDLYLEKARANYEMEIKSDIGNAMVNYTNSERKLTENEFEYVITLIQLHYLIGENYEI